ncbi:13571_t:CDS:2, partial [Racocetra fulgida]
FEIEIKDEAEEVKAEVEEDKVEEDEVREAEVEKTEVKEAEIEVEEEVDNNLKTEEVTIDEAAIIEKIYYHFEFSNSDKDSVVKIKKISYSVTLNKCKSFILYIEQQGLIKFIEDQDLPVL